MVLQLEVVVQVVVGLQEVQLEVVAAALRTLRASTPSWGAR